MRKYLQYMQTESMYYMQQMQKAFLFWLLR